MASKTRASASRRRSELRAKAQARSRLRAQAPGEADRTKAGAGAKERMGPRAAPHPLDATAEDRVIDAALALIAARGWRGLGLSDIAAEAKIGMAELYALFPSRNAILEGFVRRTDRLALAGADLAADDSAGSVRDRLFDLLMRRFDALR